MSANKLWDRINGFDTDIGSGDPNAGQIDKLPLHQFYGAFMSYEDGKATRNQVMNIFDLVDTERDDCIELFDIQDAANNASKMLQRMHAIYMLVELPQFENAVSWDDFKTWLTEAGNGGL